MSLHHNILASAYYPLKLIYSVKNLFGSSNNRLRVLLYHDISPDDQDCFAAQLRWLSRSWSFVTPKQFEAMISGEEKIRGSNLLVTFDDGFASNRVVAEQVLNPMKIKALFFVVSDFIELQNRKESRDFISKNIYYGPPPELLPENWQNMTWADLEALLEQGHCIGSHTRSHARLGLIDSQSDLEREVISGADILERRLGTSIDHFAYTFGDLRSFSDKALITARRRFRYIYSGLRGDNSSGVSPFALRRDCSALQDSQLNYKVFSNRLLGAFLEGAADFKYARDCASLDAWALSKDGAF
ncbi:MAG: polysaccharide deacetylase family protein [Deltaproteobacteria bacterium]|nr:MAG: polysaccharide deacetylase family protein [Deltaproteobacteria bacterium]